MHLQIKKKDSTTRKKDQTAKNPNKAGIMHQGHKVFSAK